MLTRKLQVGQWKVTFLEKVKTIVKAGIKSWFTALDLTGVIPFWTHLLLNKFQLRQVTDSFLVLLKSSVRL